MDADNAALNAALVNSAQDFECAMVTPVTVPRVIDEPVIHVVLSAPANDFDGVTAQQVATHVLVDSTLVGGKVGVDLEGGFDRTVSHDLGLNRAHFIDHFVARTAKDLVGDVSLGGVL